MIINDVSCNEVKIFNITKEIDDSNKTVLELLIYAVFIGLAIYSEGSQKLIKTKVAIPNDKARIDHYLSSMR